MFSMDGNFVFRSFCALKLKKLQNLKKALKT